MASFMDKLKAANGMNHGRIESPDFPGKVLQISNGKMVIRASAINDRTPDYVISQENVAVFILIGCGGNWAKYYIEFKDGKSGIITQDVLSEADRSGTNIIMAPIERFLKVTEIPGINAQNVASSNHFYRSQPEVISRQVVASETNNSKTHEDSSALVKEDFNEIEEHENTNISESPHYETVQLEQEKQEIEKIDEKQKTAEEIEQEKERERIIRKKAIRREKDRKRTIVLIINHVIGLIIGIVSIILITSVFKKFSFDRSFRYLDVRYNGDGTLYSVLNFYQILGGICIGSFVLMWITSIISLIFIKKSKLNTIFKVVSSLCGFSFGITSYLTITNFIHNDFMEIVKYINGDGVALYRSFENVEIFALTFFILTIVILIADIIVYIIVHNISKNK